MGIRCIFFIFQIFGDYQISFCNGSLILFSPGNVVCMISILLKFIDICCMSQNIVSLD